MGFPVSSTSGVVNIYKRSNDQLANRLHTPMKELMHLTTTVDNLRINHDSQILAMSSRDKKDSLRLVNTTIFLLMVNSRFCKQVHLPSCTVFSNWPTSSTPLRHVSTCDFSKNSGEALKLTNCKVTCLIVSKVSLLLEMIEVVFCSTGCCIASVRDHVA